MDHLTLPSQSAVAEYPLGTFSFLVDPPNIRSADLPFHQAWLCPRRSATRPPNHHVFSMGHLGNLSHKSSIYEIGMASFTWTAAHHESVLRSTWPSLTIIVSGINETFNKETTRIASSLTSYPTLGFPQAHRLGATCVSMTVFLECVRLCTKECGTPHDTEKLCLRKRHHQHDSG